jgi:hypothetical protein
MKIKNNSIIHQVKDIVQYKNQFYNILKIEEDLVWLSELKKPVNIFKIKPAIFINLKTGERRFL